MPLILIVSWISVFVFDFSILLFRFEWNIDDASGNCVSTECSDDGTSVPAQFKFERMNISIGPNNWIIDRLQSDAHAFASFSITPRAHCLQHAVCLVHELDFVRLAIMLDQQTPEWKLGQKFIVHFISLSTYEFLWHHFRFGLPKIQINLNKKWRKTNGKIVRFDRFWKGFSRDFPRKYLSMHRTVRCTAVDERTNEWSRHLCHYFNETIKIMDVLHKHMVHDCKLSQ